MRITKNKVSMPKYFTYRQLHCNFTITLKLRSYLTHYGNYFTPQIARIQLLQVVKLAAKPHNAIKGVITQVFCLSLCGNLPEGLQQKQVNQKLI